MSFTFFNKTAHTKIDHLLISNHENQGFTYVNSNIVEEPLNLSDHLYLSLRFDWTLSEISTSKPASSIRLKPPDLKNPFILLEFQRKVSLFLKNNFPFESIKDKPIENIDLAYNTITTSILSSIQDMSKEPIKNPKAKCLLFSSELKALKKEIINQRKKNELYSLG